MKTLLLTLTLLVLVGCGGRRVDPSVQPYFDRFVDEGLSRLGFVYGAGITIELVDDLPVIPGEVEVLGQCGNDGAIRLKRDVWEQIPQDSTRELLLFHELGHCLLHREHANNSVMSNPPPADYEERRASYLDELFSR